MKSICIAEEEVLKLAASAVRHHITDRQVLLTVGGLLYHRLHEISFGSTGVRTPQQWRAGGGDSKWYPAAPHPQDLGIFLFSRPSWQFSPSLRFGDMRTRRYVFFPLWSLKKKKEEKSRVVLPCTKRSYLFWPSL